MNASLQVRSRGFGAAGSLIGLLALIAVVLPQWVLPAVLPAASPEPVAVEVHHTLKERILAKLKPKTTQKQEIRSGPDSWKQYFPAAAMALALLAISLAVLSVFRREEKLYAGMAAALGAGAIALQLTVLFAGAVLAILVLYIVLRQPDGAFQQGAIAIGAIFLFSMLAVLGLGPVSPLLAALAIGAAIVIFGITWLLGGF
jgi:hypothetical protein